MWVEMLIQPKQDTPFQRDASMLINVPIYYDDELEKRNAHPLLLTEPEKEKPFIPATTYVVHIRQLNNPKRPNAAGVCWEVPNPNQKLALSRLNHI